MQKLYSFQETDNTPEGRMISQLKWLRERAGNYDLKLPVDPAMLSTLRRVDLDRELWHLASTPERVIEEIEAPMTRLIKLTKRGQLLLKPAYYPYAARCISALILALRNSPRNLSNDESGSIVELTHLREMLAAGKIEPPLVNYLPTYKHIRHVFSLTGSTVDDIPNAKELITMATRMIFEGVRPDTWLTPEAADKATAQWSALIV